MKVRLIRDLQQRNPRYKPDVAARRKRAGKAYPVPKHVPAPAGTVIEHKDAWQLVANGDAVPECEDSIERCRQYFASRGQSPEVGMAEAKAHRDRLQAGIDPKHFDAYEEGRMDGYDAKGRPVLGGELVELEEDQPADQFVIIVNEPESQAKERPAKTAPAETL